ncbi:unnamed protein product [Caenorhabditis nigoni]
MFFIFLLLSSLRAFCDCYHDSGPSYMDSPLRPLVPDYANVDLTWKPRNFVHYDVWKDWKTGERKHFPRSCGGLNEGATSVWPDDYDYQLDRHYNFLWSCEKSEIDGSLNLEPSACVGEQLGQKTHKIKAGETEIYKNGSIVVSCKRFEGRLQRVSTPVSGCFYNNTVYPLGAYWSEPNIGDSQTLHRFMTCDKSESGYFEKKVAGCILQSEVVQYIMLNQTWELAEKIFKKCVETELGKVDLISVEKFEDTCNLDGVTYQRGQWFDEQRGANLRCAFGKVEKDSCEIGGVLVWLNHEVKLSNGCTFLCHPQTNIYSCDVALHEMKISRAVEAANN